MGMKSFRLRRMEQYILEKDTVSMTELCDEFGISMNTARLDVAQLVDKGSIKKVYGGVTSNRQNSLVPFEERKMKHAGYKRAVCKAAAELVEDGDIIYIDSGTTTMYLIDFLKDRKNITILTHNLNAIMRAIPYPDMQIICLPGTLDRKTNSFVAADTGRVLERYNIKKAFIAAAGISLGGDVTNSSPMEFEVKKAAIDNSNHVFLLIDSSKYGKTSLLTFAGLSDMEKVIVDKDVDKSFLELCAGNNVKVQLVDSLE
ncbi:MAG: DeoR/GlpR family DNA-binding transcription regulator [Lachnospiraceae bacterium]|nr:DeoR/GlpR family DNA-binding transcription regulator [Lachnospiraceae bacterium]